MTAAAFSWGLYSMVLLMPAIAAEDSSSVPGRPAPRAYAAFAFEMPTASGGDWGSIGLGGIYGPGPAGHDASMGMSLGLGDADRYAGLDLALVISSLSRSDGGPYGFGEERSYALKLHRNLDDGAAIAIGAGSLARHGGEAFHRVNRRSEYAVYTRGLMLGDHALIVTAGVGESISNKLADGVGAFGSAAYYATTWLSVIAEASSRYTNAALSIAPLPQWLPLTLTVGYVDLMSRHNEHPELNVIAGIGYHF